PSRLPLLVSLPGPPPRFHVPVSGDRSLADRPGPAPALGAYLDAGPHHDRLGQYAWRIPGAAGVAGDRGCGVGARIGVDRGAPLRAVDAGLSGRFRIEPVRFRRACACHSVLATKVDGGAGAGVSIASFQFARRTLL